MNTSLSTDSVSQNPVTQIQAELELAHAQAEGLARESLPASDETLALYVGHEIDTSPSTLARRLSATRLMHRWSGLESPFDSTPSFAAVYTGYKRRWGGRQPVTAPHAAATESIARTLADAWAEDSLIAKRNRALLLVGFDSALRRSELVGIDVEHLTSHPEGLEIYIPHSKSDQTGRGAVAYLMSRPDSLYCPVSAMATWLDAAGIHQGSVFRRLHRCGSELRLGAERLSDKAVYRVVKEPASKCGVAGRFGAHILRRELITNALQDHQKIGPVQEHVRHRNLATTSRYNERAHGFDVHPGRRLLQP